MEGGWEKIKSQMEGKNILYMQMRMRKQKHRHLWWPPGPCQSCLSLSLSLSPFPFHCLSLHTWARLPAATVQEVDSKRRQIWGGSSREAGETAKVSISKQSWQQKVPFPLHQVCLSNYHWVSLSLQTLSNSWSRCMRTHAPGSQNWRVCVGIGMGI